jgi:molybdopterin-containing oxidoreductase family iron-sulfur binding subunit
LEAWSDARAADGTASIVQPLIAPLYDSRSPHELLAALLGESIQSAHEIVKQFWASQLGGLAGGASRWRGARHAAPRPSANAAAGLSRTL